MKTICQLNGRIIMHQTGAALAAMEANASQHPGAVASVVTDEEYLSLIAGQTTLEELRAGAKARIDLRAEQVRAKYLTAAPLQSATYVEKAREAREFKAASYPSAPFDPATWPYVDAEMRAASDATPQAACDRILAEAAQYAKVKGAAIEYERRHGKITVDATGTAAAIATAEAAAHAALDAL